MLIKVYLYGYEVWPFHQVLGLVWNTYEVDMDSMPLKDVFFFTYLFV